MINRFGFYARRKSLKLIDAIQNSKKFIHSSGFSWYAKKITKLLVLTRLYVLDVILK